MCVVLWAALCLRDAQLCEMILLRWRLRMRFVILRKSDATMESDTPASPELIEAVRQYDAEMT